MFEYFIYHYGTQIIAAILCAIFGCLGYAIKQLAVKYINDDTKRAISLWSRCGIPSTARTSWPRHWKPPKRF